MRSATSLLPVLAVLAGCAPPGLSPPPRNTDLYGVVTPAGPTVYGTLVEDVENPCELTGPDYDFLPVHPAVATVDWFAPSRPIDESLPVLAAIWPPEPDVESAPQIGFFGLTLFNIDAWQPAAEDPCSLTCGTQPVEDAYVVLLSVATDDEVAGLGFTLDEAKTKLIEWTEERDEEGQGPSGCTSLKI